MRFGTGSAGRPGCQTKASAGDSMIAVLSRWSWRRGGLRAIASSARGDPLSGVGRGAFERRAVCRGALRRCAAAFLRGLPRVDLAVAGLVRNAVLRCTHIGARAARASALRDRRPWRRCNWGRGRYSPREFRLQFVRIPPLFAGLGEPQTGTS